MTCLWRVALAANKPLQTTTNHANKDVPQAKALANNHQQEPPKSKKQKKSTLN